MWSAGLTSSLSPSLSPRGIHVCGHHSLGVEAHTCDRQSMELWPPSERRHRSIFLSTTKKRASVGVHVIDICYLHRCARRRPVCSSSLAGLLAPFHVSRTHRKPIFSPSPKQQNVLWPQDIQCPMVVGLAGLDKIAPAKPIRRFLLSYPGFADTAQSPPTLRPNGTTPATRYASTAPFYPSNNSKKNAVPSPVIAPTSIPGGFADDGHGPKVGSTTADSTASEGMAIASCHGGGCVAGGNADDVGNCGDESSVFGKGGGLRRETRRVELVFWPHLGHGHPLIRPRALDELVRTVEQQAQDFRLSA